MAIQNKIELYCFPSNGTHFLQPEDQSFHQLKAAVTEISYQSGYMDENMVINKYRFAMVLYYAIKTCRTKSAITKAWERCGALPVNPDAVAVSEYLASHKAPTGKFESNKWMNHYISVEGW